jgi:hypothetical protein
MILDPRYVDVSPLFSDRLVQREEPMGAEEMARRDTEACEWRPPCSAEEMAADLLCEEGFDEALELCRSELRTATDPERIHYFKVVETRILERAPPKDEDQLLLV